MEEKYIGIRGVKLFYLEKNPAAANTIFLLHGNSSSHRTWEYQFASLLVSDYRLIAFDLPAHGLSGAGAPETDNYSLPGIAGFMYEAVRSLAGQKPFLLAGVSMSSNIVAEMMALPIEPAGVLLEGPCILNAAFLTGRMAIPDTKAWVCFTDDPSDEDIGELKKQAYNLSSQQESDLFLKDFKMVKDKFRSRLMTSITEGRFSDQIEIIRRLKQPVLIIFGSDDLVYYSDYLDGAGLSVWRNEIVKLNKAGHWVHLDEPERFTRLLAEFAADVFK